MLTLIQALICCPLHLTGAVSNTTTSVTATTSESIRRTTPLLLLSTASGRQRQAPEHPPAAATTVLNKPTPGIPEHTTLPVVTLSQQGEGLSWETDSLGVALQ